MTTENLVYLSNVRLSFPHIAAPQVQKNENGERISYNAEFILVPNDPAWARFHQVVMTMAVAKWNKDAQAVLNLVNQDRKKRCYGSGEEKVNQKTFQSYDGYAGHVFITAGRDKMPQIIDAQGNPIDPNNTMVCQAEARKLYGGCYVNAAVKPWLQENKHGRGVRCDLVAVQFYADGTPFGEGVVDASGLFGAAPAAAAQAPAAAPWGAPAMPPAPFPAAPAAPSGLPSFLQ